MSNVRIKHLAFVLIDTFFLTIFFSERAFQLLPFLIMPFVFILFLAFFQNPQSFIRQWNSWLVKIVTFSFLFAGFYIFQKIGYFPSLNDFLAKTNPESYLSLVGKTEGLLFVFLATLSQIGFLIGILFNILAFSIPKKFSESAEDFKITFLNALFLALMFTMAIVLGVPFISSLLFN